jgi:hypothetical protein
MQMELRCGFSMKISHHPSLIWTLSGVFRSQLPLQVGDSNISTITTTIDSGIIEICVIRREPDRAYRKKTDRVDSQLIQIGVTHDG